MFSVALNPGTADQLADQLEQLADVGDSKNPLTETVLAQAVADARAYVTYLREDFGPRSGGVVVAPPSNVYATADALADLILEETGQGGAAAKGDTSSPVAKVPPWAWAVLLAVGAAGFYFATSKSGRRGVLA